MRVQPLVSVSIICHFRGALQLTLMAPSIVLSEARTPLLSVLMQRLTTALTHGRCAVSLFPPIRVTWPWLSSLFFGVNHERYRTRSR